jgi:hypothetical protein
MATLALAPPKYSPCHEKKLLTQAFLDALRHLLDLQDRHAEVSSLGREHLDRFEIALSHALQQRDQAREAYILHVREHVC